MTVFRNRPTISCAWGSPEPMPMDQVLKSGMPKMPSNGVRMSATRDAIDGAERARDDDCDGQRRDIALEQEVAKLLDHDCPSSCLIVRRQVRAMPTTLASSGSSVTADPTNAS